MTQLFVHRMIEVAIFVIAFGVPFLVIVFPQIPHGLYSLRRRMLIAVLIGWPLIIGQQYLSRQHEPPIDPTEELGTDLGRGLMPFVGWMVILYGSIPSLAICAVDDFRRRRGLSGLVKPFKTKNAEQVAKIGSVLENDR